MPKIGKYTAKIKGNAVDLTIMYNRKRNFYFAEELSEIIRLTEWGNWGFPTEANLIETFKNALREYHKIISETKKVIIVSFAVGINSAMDKTGQGSWSGKDGKWRNVDHFDLEYGVGFSYKIMMEKKGEETMYHYLKEDGTFGYKEYLSTNQIVIAYSEKKEAFLKELIINADAMANKFVDFFLSNDLNKILEAGTIKLLLTE